MFTKDKSAQSERFGPASATLISEGTVVTGDIASDNDLRIDGKINGNVTSAAKIIIGASGFVEGHLKGQNADISGRVVGNVAILELLQLRGNSDLKGNVAAGKLQVDPTAVFNGQCQMGTAGNIVQMGAHELQEADSQ